MPSFRWPCLVVGLTLMSAAVTARPAADTATGRHALGISWADNMLTLRDERLPGGVLRVWYLEAFCRPGSTDRDWDETVIPHKTELLNVSADATHLRLRSTLADGVRVEHDIRAGRDDVSFALVASNPTATASEANWAQPCIRVDQLAGVQAIRASEEYLPRCFIFLDGRPVRLPTRPWARNARYTPGQVWCPAQVDRRDVNPRPLSDLVPSNGLIGCYSADEKLIVATAWEPYQELFQGVIVCLHSDFRIGGLRPGETKRIRGKIYVVEADMDGLLARYRRDFPEH